MKNQVSIHYQIPNPNDLEFLYNLPWYKELDQWKSLQKIKILNIRKGNHRHPVIFVENHKKYLAIKQIPANLAKKELTYYQQLNSLGISTLHPIGVVSVQSPPEIMTGLIGAPVIYDDMAFIVTQLQRDVLPDNDILKRPFQQMSEQKIFAAITQLFVKLHANHFYWGDGSINNVLIRFRKAKYPGTDQKKTILDAIVVDVETMEYVPNMSENRRMEDWEIFFESMEWTLEDLKISGIHKEFDLNLVKKEMLETYQHWFLIEQSRMTFEQVTDLHSGAFNLEWLTSNYFQLFMTQIEEHKWYMSEKKRPVVTMQQAAQNWYETVFIPSIKAMADPDVEQLFPGISPTELFADIMTHKYYLSKQHQMDIGLEKAVEDYAKRFGHHQQLFPYLQNFVSKFNLSISSKPIKKKRN